MPKKFGCPKKLGLFLLFMFFASFSLAQQVSQQARKVMPELSLFAGGSSLDQLDNGFDHLVLGGSLGMYVKNRLQVGPQFWYTDGPGNEHNASLTGFMAYDLMQNQRSRLYAIGGLGMQYRKVQFESGPTFSATELSASGGLGLKHFISQRVFVVPEFRVGHEPRFLATIGIGYRFKK